MTKITTTRTFDKGLIADEDLRDKLTPMIDFYNSGFENFIRVLSNGVGTNDNQDAIYKTIALESGVPVQFTLPKKALFISVGKQSPITTPMQSFVWDFITDFKVQVIAVFNPVPASAVQVTLEIKYS